MTRVSLVGDVLDDAANLIEPEGKWTQGCYARDADGNMVLPSDEIAHCFCALGAISRVCEDKAGGSYFNLYIRARAIWAAQLDLEPSSVTTFNDGFGRTQAEVIAKLREAATLAREQQA